MCNGLPLPQHLVIPAKAGIQETQCISRQDRDRWIPAFAGMTIVSWFWVMRIHTAAAIRAYPNNSSYSAR